MANENSVIDYAVEAIAKFVREFRDDVREKVVEEPTYGRTLTNDQSRDDRELPPLRATASVEVGIGSSNERGPSFAEQISDRSRGLTAPDHEQDHGIDR